MVAVGGGGGPSLSSRNQDVSGKTQNKNASLPFFSDSSPPLLYARCSYVYSINICVGIPLPLHPPFLDVTLEVRVGLFSELEKGCRPIAAYRAGMSDGIQQYVQHYRPARSKNEETTHLCITFLWLVFLSCTPYDEMICIPRLFCDICRFFSFTAVRHYGSCISLAGRIRTDAGCAGDVVG